ncbi:MAG: bifunctional 2-polyprenyl-6-hydroxyphenol methylase/3-demethylubiquinol 3-O-methyltransferase UbiG [Pseudomonadota bacterium]
MNTQTNSVSQMDDDPGSITRRELAKFEAMADEWWDPDGKFKPLHRFNPVRLAWLRTHLIRHFVLDAMAHKPLAGLSVLDIGCGGGLVAEPMARLGATVTGIDASLKTVQIADAHPREEWLKLSYRCCKVEELLEEKLAFDLVLNLEIVEHVPDPSRFLQQSASLVKPGGLMAVATLNRTAKAFLLAIIGAEYILRWLPRGTHSWRAFLHPHEVARPLLQAGMQIAEQKGVVYNPLSQRWRLSDHDLDVNYLSLFERPNL